MGLTKITDKPISWLIKWQIFLDKQMTVEVKNLEEIITKPVYPYEITEGMDMRGEVNIPTRIWAAGEGGTVKWIFYLVYKQTRYIPNKFYYVSDIKVDLGKIKVKIVTKKIRTFMGGKAVNIYEAGKPIKCVAIFKVTGADCKDNEMWLNNPFKGKLGIRVKGIVRYHT